MADEFEIVTQFDSSGIAQLAQGKADAAALINLELEQAAKEAGAIGLSIIGPLTPYLTGRLLRSEQFAIEKLSPTLVAVSWFSDVEYASFQEARRHMFEGGIETSLDELIQPFEEAGERIASKLEGSN